MKPPEDSYSLFRLFLNINGLLMNKILAKYIQKQLSIC